MQPNAKVHEFSEVSAHGCAGLPLQFQLHFCLDFTAPCADHSRKDRIPALRLMSALSMLRSKQEQNFLC